MPLQAPVSALIDTQQRKAGVAISNLIAPLQNDDPNQHTALNTLQNAINDIYQQMTQTPTLEELTVVDPSGAMIGWIGDQVFNGVVYEGGWFKQLYIGGSDPSAAVISTDINGNVSIVGASIVVTSGNVTVTIDPSHSGIRVRNTVIGNQAVVDAGDVVLSSGDGAGHTVAPNVDIQPATGFTMTDVSNNGIVELNYFHGLRLYTSGGATTVSFDPATGNGFLQGTLNAGHLSSADCTVSSTYQVFGNQVVKARLGAIGTLSGAATLATTITKVNQIITNVLGISGSGHGLTSD